MDFAKNVIRGIGRGRGPAPPPPPPPPLLALAGVGNDVLFIAGSFVVAAAVLVAFMRGRFLTSSARFTMEREDRLLALEKELALVLSRNALLNQDLSDAIAGRQSLQEELQTAWSTSRQNREVGSSAALQEALSESRTKAARFESMLIAMEEKSELDQTEMQERSLRQQGEIESLHEELSATKRQLDDATSKVATLTSRIYLQEAEIKMFRDKKFVPENISDFQTQVKVLSQEKATLQSEHALCKEQLQDERAAKMSAQIDLTTSRNDVIKLRQSLAIANKEIEAKGEVVAALTNRCDDLERKAKIKVNGADGGCDQLSSEGALKTTTSISSSSSSSNSSSSSGSGNSYASSVFDGTMDLLAAPIVPISSLFGIVAASPQKPLSDVDSTSPNGTVTSPVRPNRVSVVRTHEKLLQKRTGGSSESPMRSPLRGFGPPPFVVDSRASGDSSGVLGAKVVALSKRDRVHPSLSEFVA